MKFRGTFVDLLQPYDPGVVCILISLPHDVYLSQDVFSAGFPSPALLEHLGGILLPAAFVSTPLHNGEFSPMDVANVNATAYTRQCSLPNSTNAVNLGNTRWSYKIRINHAN